MRPPQLAGRLLLRHAVERAAAGDEARAQRPTTVAAGEERPQDVERPLRLRVAVDGHEHGAVGDVEVGVGQRQPLAFELDARCRERQLDDPERRAAARRGSRRSTSRFARVTA